MDTTSTTPDDVTHLPQGDTRLLDTSLAHQLLRSTIPARMAYTALDGTPRVIPTWFHWNGTELVMATFLAAPHVGGPARRLPALAKRSNVAVSIDTEGFPPEILQLRGRVAIDDVDGVAAEYAAAAARYLGEDAATEYLAQVDQPGTRMSRIVLRPTWVGLLDFQTRSPGALT